MSRRLLPASVVLASGALALGYGLGGLWPGVIFGLACGLLWLVALWRGWPWASSVGFVACSAAAVAGLLLDLGAGWLLAAIVAALSAWDLDAFVGRLRDVERVSGRRDLERRHLLRLLSVDALGLALAAAALGIRLRLTFVVVLLLGSLVILGISRTVGFLRRESD